MLICYNVNSTKRHIKNKIETKEIEQQNVSLIEVKENIFTKFLKKIKNLFNAK